MYSGYYWSVLMKEMNNFNHYFFVSVKCRVLFPKPVGFLEVREG